MLVQRDAHCSEKLGHWEAILVIARDAAAVFLGHWSLLL